MSTSLQDISYALEPIAWFLATIPLFHYSLSQPLKRRWQMLPFHILLPVQCYRKADHLSVAFPESVWFVALTALCAAVHHTSALVLECWSLPELRKACPGRTETAVVLKAWMNLRRSALESHPGSTASITQRARFLGRKSLEAIALIIVCIAVETFILVALEPTSDDFAERHRKYFHWTPDRQALFRLCLAFHWAWLSIVFSHIIHSAMAIIFVIFLQLDHPDDWPPLFGNPLEAYSLRRFWGTFWHKIAAPSQAVYGRVISRHVLGFLTDTPSEKTFLALWIFTFSGIVHAFVNFKADPDLDSWLDFHFLLLSFVGGFLELLVIRSIPSSVRHRIPKSVRRIVGFVWVYIFFYCTVPAYQWPAHHKEAIRRETAFR